MNPLGKFDRSLSNCALGRQVKNTTLASRTAALLGLFLVSCIQLKMIPATLAATPKPNIIFILADDLGYAELGCYGQTKIKTPNIDRLAAEGIRFTQHYSGSPVCAPSRCVLLTGKHTGHAHVRANRGMTQGRPPRRVEGQLPIPRDTVTLAKILKQEGYATAAIGKWGLGGPDSEGHPNKQGFDHWFGYLCQTHAHSYYPEYLWRNSEKVILEGNVTDQAKGKQYSHDLISLEALQFIEKSNAQPFFLYLAYTIPHAALQVPDDSLAEYAGQFPETPYDGKKGYLPHPIPRAAYAAMVSRLDRDVGRIMNLLKQRGIDQETVVFFSSDNGPTFNGGTDSKFFHSAGPFRGLKTELYEGGIRVPFIVRWPGHIKPSMETDRVSSFCDVLPTLAEIGGAEPPNDIDGISVLPTLLGKRGQKKHRYLFWEYHERGVSQAVRMGNWKAIRHQILSRADGPIELYDLTKDIAERNDVAARYPKMTTRMAKIMEEAHTPSKEFPLPGEKGK